MATSKTNAGRRFLIVRHRTYRRFFFEVILRWLEANLPHLRPWFEVRDLPVRVKDWSRYALHVAWLQDPVQHWSPKTYDRALELLRQCDRRGIPVVNRVDRLMNATKSRGAKLMSEAGVHVPRMAEVHDIHEFERTLLGLQLPLFIRENWGHERKVIRIDRPDEARQIPWKMFERPLAVEVVDVRNPSDGWYQKYRYVAAGEVGISHHLHISRDWITRGESRVVRQQTCDEELRYISRPDPNHAALQQASRALGLEMVAFDYGCMPDGQMVVWEANAFPHLLFARKRLVYKNPAMHRTLLAIVRLYFVAAGLPVPSEVEDGLGLSFAELERRYQSVRKTTFMDRLLVWPRSFPSWPT